MPPNSPCFLPRLSWWTFHFQIISPVNPSFLLLLFLSDSEAKIWIYSNNNSTNIKFYTLVSGPNSVWQDGDELIYPGPPFERVKIAFVGGRPERGRKRESFVWLVWVPVTSGVGNWMRLGDATGPKELEERIRAYNGLLGSVSQHGCWDRFQFWPQGQYQYQNQNQSTLNDVRRNLAAGPAPAAAAVIPPVAIPPVAVPAPAPAPAPVPAPVPSALPGASTAPAPQSSAAPTNNP
ncbi:hypothetical protein A1O3_07191 [Capronia epimyces CBS 606.96]|uniref:Uncharacterized protein n=1 Tax=Capronia epimyces CBS 606.96 TaxID=1182542 RepID=W9XL46_9EURO|nr:uncharacterized protein A1O3_07191 [Capronia epimyces CBS 606.96]EXJ80903.1 hypothetical protein A1O3_07191 [Capronia epimyces CBS 606.96]